MTFLTLIPDYFARWQDWQEVCNQLNVPHEVDSIEVKVSSIKWEKNPGLDFYIDE